MSNAGIYDVILTILVVVLMIWVSVLTERYRGLREDVDRLRSDSAARSTPIAQARAHHRVPGVDATARTTRRDSNDLPLTGRMSQGVKRVRYDARTSNDDRLPEHPGSPTAQEWGSEGSA